MLYVFFINKNDMKGGQSEKQKKEKLVKKINKQIWNVAKRMDNPRAGVYLSPWDIKVSGLPQADHKHNRTFRFTLRRVLVCIIEPRSGDLVDVWMALRPMACSTPYSVFTGSVLYYSLLRSV